MEKVKMEAPHTEPIIVAPLHHPKMPVALASLSKTKKKKDEPSELFDPKHYVAPANALLTYRGGPLLAKTKVYTIFWGKKWNSDTALKTIATNLNKFFTAILVSPLMDQMAEYNVAGYHIGHGSLSGTKKISVAAPTTTISDAQIRTALQGWIHASTVPANDVNTLYFIYFEPNIKIIMGGSASCTSFCGYHNNIGNNLFYAAIPYPSCSGCLGGLPTAFDALTGTSSHELCEAITDALPGSGWYDNDNGEIGDICAWTFKTIAGYTVQKEWSNAARNCL